MSITDPQEFWNALGRLYDSTLALKDATEALRAVAASHERRIDYWEVVSTALRDDIRQMKRDIAELQEKTDGQNGGKS